MSKIALKDLATRESERVEWKENVAEISDVIKTIVAFANDFSNLGGGYVVCGAKEGKDDSGFQKVFFSGLSASRFSEIEGQVLSDCRQKVDPPIVPTIEEVTQDGNDKRGLVFIVPASGYAHCYRSGSKDSSTYYIRIGRETREARNGLLRELLVRKGALEPWDRRVNGEASIQEIDLLILRDYLQQMALWDPQKGLEDYLSASEQLSSFVPPLAGKEKLTEVLKPRNFTLLMFSKKPTKYFPGAFSVLSIYKGKDRSEPVAEKHEEAGPIVEQAKKLIELLNTEAYTAFDKDDPRPNQVKYPKRALQEAIVNAIVHRDYESDQPTRITVFINRIEINSPGELPRTIDKDKFVKGLASPFWRNQALAYFFSKMQLAQSEGQGIPTIIRTMHDEGCPEPEFEFGLNNLICTLPAHPRHELIRELHEIENNIILGNYNEANRKLLSLLEKDPYNFRSLELFCEVNNLSGTPEIVFKFFKTHEIDITSINPSTLISIAETLILIQNDESARELAQELLNQAKSGRLEEAEIRKIAMNYRKAGNNDKANEFVNDIFAKNNHLASNSGLLELRAQARIDLAKKCMETGRNRISSPEIRQKAWNQCRFYLEEAEKDLQKALANSSNDIQRDYITRDMDFLKTMQALAQKPKSSHRRHRGGREHRPFGR